MVRHLCNCRHKATISSAFVPGPQESDCVFDTPMSCYGHPHYLGSCLSSYYGQCRRQTTTDSAGQGSNSQIPHSLWHPTTCVFLDAIVSSQHRWNASFHDDNNCTYVVATIHLWLCKPAPVPATKPLFTVHPGEHRGSSPVAMQKHMAENCNISSCKSNILLPVRREPLLCGKMGSEAVAVRCSLPLCCSLASYHISYGLPMHGRLLKAKTRLYLCLSALDVIQGLHILCSFAFYLAFVLFIQGQQSCPFSLHSQTVWWLLESINHVCGNISFQGFPDPSVLPRWQAEAVPLYVSGQM